MLVSYHPCPVDATKSWQYAKGFVSTEILRFSDLALIIGTKVWSPIIWMDGNRKQDNFLRADFVALDFDDGELSLDEAKRIWCDSNHIIATTKSHQKEKGNKRACDRFRVVLELSRSLNELKHYKETMRHLVDRYPCDPACKDGGRFFYPCTNVVSVCSDGYQEDPVMLSPAREAFRETKKMQRLHKYQMTGEYPLWLNAFLEDGVCIGDGRNHTVYVAIRRLLDLGVHEDKAIALVRHAPIVSGSFTAEERDHTIKSACDGHKRSLTSTH